MKPPLGLAGRLLEYSDLAAAAMIVVIIGMMVIPLPHFILSLLLVFNLTFGLIILLVTLYTHDPLEFAVFPSVLLLTTLFRLALNVSSTRLILLQGYAGEVIQQFGHFVVGGNPVVGFVVFLILVAIQFVVITRGAERVAEVAARFMLDAMPGKQMSIDADLNAGLIDDHEARERRKAIAREADFYGSMDGASKFVKGDAIAAIIISIINILGGFVVGAWQLGLPLEEALTRYTLLTVGDGLVSQIPALLLSVATGIVVTRAVSEVDLGHEVAGQLLREPRVFYIAGAVLLGLGVVPGLPLLPFLVIGSLAAVVGRNLTGMQLAEQKERERDTHEAKEKVPRSDGPEEMARLLQVDPVSIEIGYGLLPLADNREGDDLMERIGMLRRQLATELGMVLPLVRLRDNMALDANAYQVKLRGVTVASADLMADRYLAMDAGGAEGEISGLDTVEPAFGLPAKWIPITRQDAAERQGYTVVDPVSVMMTHLGEVLKKFAHELLSRQEVKIILDAMRETSPAVVDELVPEVLSLGDVQKVLQNLLREGVPIRDLLSVFEALADYGPIIQDTDRLSELVRASLYRTITHQLPVHEGRLRVIILAPDVEQSIADAIEHTDGGAFVALNPDVQSGIIRNAKEVADECVKQGLEPVVLTSPGIRFYFKRLAEQAIEGLTVVSYQEIEPAVEIEAIGKVTLS